MNEKITTDILKKYLSYSPDTGQFIWIDHPIYKNKVGKTAGARSKEGYIIISICGRYHKAHRLAWLYYYNEWPNVIDHLNGVRDDNRIKNLRNTDMRGNASNMERHRNGHLLGAQYFKRDNKWDASCWVNGKKYHIGRFDTEQEAHKAYLFAIDNPDTIKSKKEERLKEGIPVGVVFCKKGKKWRVRLQFDGKRINFGSFASIDDAKSRITLISQFIEKYKKTPSLEDIINFIAGESAEFEKGTEDIEEGA